MYDIGSFYEAASVEDALSLIHIFGAILAILPGIYLGLPTVILLPLSLILSVLGCLLYTSRCV